MNAAARALPWVVGLGLAAGAGSVLWSRLEASRAEDAQRRAVESPERSSGAPAREPAAPEGGGPPPSMPEGAGGWEPGRAGGAPAGGAAVEWAGGTGEPSARAAAGSRAARGGAGADANDEGEEPEPWPATSDGIQGGVRESLPEMKECYEAWLEAEPGLAGKVSVSFTIAPESAGDEAGTVTAVRVLDSSVGHAVMEGCVQAVLSDLRFEPPREAVTVHYPLVFAADRGGGEQAAGGRQ